MNNADRIQELKIRQLTNQYLVQPADKKTVIRDLCGVQAQFLVNAMHSLKIRCNDFDENTVADGLVKNWTVRGTVHVFAESDLPLFIRCNNGEAYRKNEWGEVKNWLNQLPVESIDCEGKTYYYIPNGKSYDKEIPACIFLAGFDQLMLGYQKKESLYLPQEHLRSIFNLAGIVMPPILLNGKVVGKWKKKNADFTFTLFETVSDKEKKIISNTAENLWDSISKITFE